MTEREHERGEGHREKRPPQGAGSPMLEEILEVQGHDLSPRQSLNQLSHAGARLQTFFKKIAWGHLGGTLSEGPISWFWLRSCSQALAIEPWGKLCAPGRVHSDSLFALPFPPPPLTCALSLKQKKSFTKMNNEANLTLVPYSTSKPGEEILSKKKLPNVPPETDSDTLNNTLTNWN